MTILLEKLALSCIRLCSVLVFFVPVIVTESTFFPYIFGKMIVFQLLVEIAFAAWVILCVREPLYRPNLKNPVTLSLILFLAALVVTAFTGVNPAHSFWSSQERMTGVIALLHFGAWYLVLTSTFKSWSAWRACIIASLLCSLAITIIALGQIQGIPLGGLSISEGRVTATLGNPIYVGVYGLFGVFLSVLLWLRESSRGYRLLCIASIFFNAILILGSGSRSIFVVAALLLVATVPIFLIRLKKWGRKFLFVGVITLGLASIFVTIMVASRGIAPHPPQVINRILSQGFIDYSRLELWRLGIQGFLERPLFGWGLENYKAVYNAHSVPERGAARVQEAFYDRSHNQFVDLLSLTGILGTSAYVVLLLSAVRYGLRRSLAKRDRLFSVVILLGIGAYLLANLTVFDTPTSLIFFYFFLALLAAQHNGPQEYAPPRSMGKLKLLSIGGVTLGTLGIMASTIIAPWSSSSHTINALRSLSQGLPGVALDEFRSALNTHSYPNKEIRRALADSALAMLQNNDPKRARLWWNYAVSEMEKNIVDDPYDVRNHLLLSRLYLSGPHDNSLDEKIEKTLAHAVSVAPNRVDVLLLWAAFEGQRTDYARAHEWVSRARALDPRNKNLQAVIPNFENTSSSGTLE